MPRDACLIAGSCFAEAAQARLEDIFRQVSLIAVLVALLPKVAPKRKIPNSKSHRRQDPAEWME